MEAGAVADPAVDAGALLVRPGLQTNTSVVPLANITERAPEFLGCCAAALWPYEWQLDAVRGPDGRARRFDIWVGEARFAAGRAANVCASLAAHPFSEANGRLIAGPALLVPLGGAAYTLEDWDQICKGVWSLECDCMGHCERDSGACPRVSLVEANIQGPLAAKARA